MLKKWFLIEGSGLSKKDIIGSSFLLLNAITWYFMSLNVINGLLSNASSVNQTVVVMGSYYSAIVLSSFGNAFLSSKIKRRDLLLIWTSLGIIASLLPIVIVGNSVGVLILIASLFGFSFGFGMPSCLSYFADVTLFENRGRIGGLIFFVTNLSAVAFVIFSSVINSLLVVLLYMAIWRSLSLCTFRLSNFRKIKVSRTEHTSFRLIFRSKPFLFYIIPWLMFGLVDSLEKIYLQSYLQASFGTSFFQFNQIIEAIIGAVSAIVIGVIADFVGRKRVIVYGFISLGLAYAMIGLAPFVEILWYFYSVIDGVAWGIFLVMFTLVVWGDLSSPRSFREKVYTIGSIPLFISKFTGVLFLPYTKVLPQESAYTAFSLAAFFLFLAVVPLMYAPETLPEKKIRERELKNYIKKAKKTKKKYD